MTERSRAGYKVYRTRRWQMTRRSYLFDHPLCEECGAIAEIVHHLKDLKDGGDAYATANLQALCGSCHSGETRRRQLAGGKEAT